MRDLRSASHGTHASITHRSTMSQFSICSRALSAERERIGYRGRNRCFESVSLSPWRGFVARQHNTGTVTLLMDQSDGRIDGKCVYFYQSNLFRCLLLEVPRQYRFLRATCRAKKRRARAKTTCRACRRAQHPLHVQNRQTRVCMQRFVRIQDLSVHLCACTEIATIKRWKSVFKCTPKGKSFRVHDIARSIVVAVDKKTRYFHVFERSTCKNTRQPR